ncbi:unnamed protein product [Dibothriocephalus latus]|uniref:Uncharacterized protein n=1 Tax=Dibothriocephalus latus TaxID=60516 RepID=A0A3P7P7A7_DIBLA|nr:unnamed protein product [Dibothriocephalus latus]
MLAVVVVRVKAPALIDKSEDEDAKKSDAPVVTSQPDAIPLPYTGDAYPPKTQQNGPSNVSPPNDPVGTYKSFGSPENS